MTTYQGLNTIRYFTHILFLIKKITGEIIIKRGLLFITLVISSFESFIYLNIHLQILLLFIKCLQSINIISYPNY